MNKRIILLTLLFALLAIPLLRAQSNISYTVALSSTGTAASGELDDILDLAKTELSAGNNVTVYFNISSVNAVGNTLVQLSAPLAVTDASAGSLTFIKHSSATSPQGIQVAGTPGNASLAMNCVLIAAPSVNNSFHFKIEALTFKGYSNVNENHVDNWFVLSSINNVEVKNCSFYQCFMNGGAILNTSEITSMSVSGTTFQDGDMGIQWSEYNSDGGRTANLSITNNTFKNLKGLNLYLAYPSDHIIANDVIISGNTFLREMMGYDGAHIIFTVEGLVANLKISNNEFTKVFQDDPYPNCVAMWLQMRGTETLSGGLNVRENTFNNFYLPLLVDNGKGTNHNVSIKKNTLIMHDEYKSAVFTGSEAIDFYGMQKNWVVDSNALSGYNTNFWIDEYSSEVKVEPQFIGTNTLGYSPQNNHNSFTNTNSYSFKVYEDSPCSDPNCPQYVGYFIGLNLDRALLLKGKQTTIVRQTQIHAANPIQVANGANDGMLPPVITQAYISDVDKLNLAYSLPGCTAPHNYALDVYKSNDEGHLLDYIGTITITAAQIASSYTSVLTVPGSLNIVQGTPLAFTVTGLGNGTTIQDRGTSVATNPTTTAYCNTGCTLTIAGADYDAHTLNTGEQLCISAKGKVYGNIVLNGGTICNDGLLNPFSIQVNSGTILNHGEIKYAGTLELKSASVLENYADGKVEVGQQLLVHNAARYTAMHPSAFIRVFPLPIVSVQTNMAGIDSLPDIDSVFYKLTGPGLYETGWAHGIKTSNINPPTAGKGTLDLSFYTHSSSDTIHIRYDVDSLGTVSNGRVISGIDPVNTNNAALFKSIGNQIIISPIVFIIAFQTPQYTDLLRKPDAGYRMVQNGLLYFRYFEEYADKDNKLFYSIYDYRHNTVTSSALTTAKVYPVVYGDNRYLFTMMDCDFTTGGSLGNGYYMLEVTNEKNEKWYLRFSNTNTISIDCNTGNNGGN